MELKDKIKALRGKERQADFGARFGVDQATVSRWESGGEMKPDNLLAVAKYAGQTVEDFLVDVSLRVSERSAEITSLPNVPTLDTALWDAAVREATAMLAEAIKLRPSLSQIENLPKLIRQVYDDLALERARDTLGVGIQERAD